MPRALPGPAAIAAESDLSARALAGDDGAWSALIARHERSVLAFLLGRGVPLPRAKELAQETWLRLLSAQRDGKLPELALPGLAFRQASFLLADERRRRAEALDLGDGSQAIEEHLTDERSDPLETLCSKRELERARAVLASFPPRAQRIFALAHTPPGRSHAEIAGELGLSTQRVRQTLVEIRQRLRAVFEEPCR